MMLSIVTGTHNRLGHLQAMIHSARVRIPSSIPHEFVVVDAGSDDGTLDWCREQDDITLIEHGDRRGAIRAFCDGAFAATGDYVVLANDDIEFAGDGLVRALTYLETHPGCGAVAFADKRPAPGYESFTGYKVQSINALDSRARPVSVYYAQVGMYRRWLGDLCGWWGSPDDVFIEHAWTYGGDNYLSARIWEHGYSVDAVDGCYIDDHVIHDDLRAHNFKREDHQVSAYYQRYPKGPTIADEPQAPNPQGERLRVLYLPIFEPGYPHQRRTKRGLKEALQRVGVVYEVDYMNEVYNLAQIVANFQPHVLFTQVQAADAIPESAMQAARQAKPDMVIINWNGDVYPHGLTSPEMLSWLRHVDVQLTVNADVLDTYAAHGINAHYWQVAFEPVDTLPDMPSHDVVFLGNAYSDERKALGKALCSANANVGIYGSGWEGADGDTLYDFEAGAALYNNAVIAIGDNQWPDKGFVSNRIFEALANGAFLMHQRVDGLKELTGLIAGVHYIQWNTLDELPALIEWWLADERKADRDKIATSGQRYVRYYHSFDMRLQQLFTGILTRKAVPA